MCARPKHARSWTRPRVPGALTPLEIGRTRATGEQYAGHRGESAVSDSEAYLPEHRPERKIERWCNAVSAELLVPLADMRAAGLTVAFL